MGFFIAPVGHLGEQWVEHEVLLSIGSNLPIRDTGLPLLFIIEPPYLGIYGLDPPVILAYMGLNLHEISQRLFYLGPDNLRPRSWAYHELSLAANQIWRKGLVGVGV